MDNQQPIQRPENDWLFNTDSEANTAQSYLVSPLTETASLPPYSPSATPLSGSSQNQSNPTTPSVAHSQGLLDEKRQVVIDDENLPEVVNNVIAHRVAEQESQRYPVLSTNPDDLPEVRTDNYPEAHGSSTAGPSQEPKPEAKANKITPLQLLGDRPDNIDCPFCERQSMTEVKKKPSNFTHLQAVFLLLTTVCGAAAPYVGKWSYDVEQYCSSCKEMVAHRAARSANMQLCKVPDSMREVSKYPRAGP